MHEVLTERRGHVLLITINRPEARNAVNAAVSTAIGEALEQAEADAQVRVVVITGAGDKAFCAGADLKALAQGERPLPDGEQATWGFAGLVKHPISKPLIAAVNGVAMGGGTEIVLASDIVVASEQARLALPEVRRGIIAAAGGAFRGVAQLPPKVALEMLLTGEPIGATRAYELGLINHVVAQQAVLETALAIADTIAANAPLAVQASKRIARGIIEGSIPTEEALWQLSDKETAAVMNSDDAREGPRAFAEKRDPVWTAR